MNEIHVDLADLLGAMQEKGLPDPGLVSYYQNLERRTIIINQEITEDICFVADHIIRWNQDDDDKHIEPKDRMPIVIMINTPGGDLYATQYVCDIIEASKTPVYTVGMATCYSAGGLLLMAGHKRMIHKNTKFLLHDGYTDMGGSAGKFTDAADFFKKVEETVKQFVVSHTHITPEEFDMNYRRDWFMMADEIIKYGIADEIVTQL